MSANDEAYAALGKLSTALGALALVPLLALFRAWVALKMWVWFAIPLGAPAIGMAHAYGLCLLIGIVGISATYHGEDKRETATKLLAPFMTIAMFWLFGAITHAVMS